VGSVFGPFPIALMKQALQALQVQWTSLLHRSFTYHTSIPYHFFLSETTIQPSLIKMNFFTPRLRLLTMLNIEQMGKFIQLDGNDFEKVSV
jgi:hypothetical protein